MQCSVPYVARLLIYAESVWVHWNPPALIIYNWISIFLMLQYISLLYLTWMQLDPTLIQAIDRNHYGLISLSELQESLEVAKVWRLRVWRHISPSSYPSLPPSYPPSLPTSLLHPSFPLLSFFIPSPSFPSYSYSSTSTSSHMLLRYDKSIKPNSETVWDFYQYHLYHTSIVSYFSHFTALHFLA